MRSAEQSNEVGQIAIANSELTVTFDFNWMETYFREMDKGKRNVINSPLTLRRVWFPNVKSLEQIDGKKYLK